MTTKKRGPFNYSRDPPRSSSHLIIHGREPFNAEPTLPVLVRHYQTPTPEFFKRNHGPIPELDAATHLFRIKGPMVPCGEVAMSVPTLRERFTKRTITAALECAGNRRDGLNRLAKVRGVIWGPGAIGNASWAGAPLRDVLLSAGVPDVTDSTLRDWHVAFEGEGEAQEAVRYGSSIPLWMAMAPNRDVLLAYEMNGTELTRDHGYPVRVIVPGVIGARSVKWLSTITVQQHESTSFYQKRDYKILPPHVRENDLAEWWPRLTALQELSVQSVICEPTENQQVPAGPYTIRGYAISGGGRAIERVDVSLDGGNNWTHAELFRPSLEHDRHWGWTLWSLRVPRIPADAEIVCRALDVSGNSQPENPTYNFRGVMNNAYFRVRVLPSPKC